MYYASLVIDQEQFKNAIVEHLVSKFTDVVSNMIGPVKARVRHSIGELIKESPEYQSLTDPRGQLHGELGVVDPVSVIDDIIKAISDNIEVEPIRFVRHGDSFSGGMIVRVLKADFSEVLGLQTASFTSEQGHHVPWLEWLLFGGTKVLLQAFWYLHDNTTENASRTHLGIMVPVGNKHQQGWSVSQHWGDSEDNWLTRALRRLVEGEPSKLHEIFQSELTQRM